MKTHLKAFAPEWRFSPAEIEDVPMVSVSSSRSYGSERILELNLSEDGDEWSSNWRPIEGGWDGALSLIEAKPGLGSVLLKVWCPFDMR